MVIWLPEPLFPQDNPNANTVIAEQIRAFEASENGLQIEIRLKQEQDIGGTLSTLRTASVVAPGALPDVTLLRHDDLLTARQAGLIYPLAGSISSNAVGDLYPAALQLGRVDGKLFGLPYMLEVQYLIYRPEKVTFSSSKLDDLLRSGTAFSFPAARSDGVNDVFALQYWAAGGTLPVSSAPALNVDALRETLRFYEQATQAGVIDPDVLEYSEATDYLADLDNGTLNAAVVNSSLYFRLLAQGQNWRAVPVPTSSGKPVTTLNGWMWVLTTQNADRQALAERFINWMMDAEQQALYAKAVYMIPSQRSAAHIALTTAGDADLLNTMLANPSLLLTSNGGGTLARAMQSALVSVITGQRTADQATQEVIAQAGK
jgi:ABC-type glycerol-3-phosphate transport system substrate-binding protein